MNRREMFAGLFLGLPALAVWARGENAETVNPVKDIVSIWEQRACKYFLLAERETDPPGQKFYQSSAVAYANCAAEARAQRFQDCSIVKTVTDQSRKW